MVSLQLGQATLYSSVYSASLSRSASSAASAAAGFTASSAILGSFGAALRPHYAGTAVRNRAVR
jgi:hypothetical protein